MAVLTNREIAYNPRTKQYRPVLVSESLTCANITIGTDTEPAILLTEQPYFDFDNFPVTVVRNSDSLTFSQTNADTIGSTEFLVDYTTGSGRVLFNSSNNGQLFNVTYYSIGSINTVQNLLNSGALSDLGSLDAGSQKITNLADGTLAASGKDSVTAGQLFTTNSNVTTNANNIATNAADISMNAGNISTNATNIATNAANIAAFSTNPTNQKIHYTESIPGGSTTAITTDADVYNILALGSAATANITGVPDSNGVLFAINRAGNDLNITVHGNTVKDVVSSQKALIIFKANGSWVSVGQ